MQKVKIVQEAALKYLHMGFSVIPVNRNKKPLLKWEEYQIRKATPEEVEAWFQKWPWAQVGIITGSISGIVVIDIDEAEGFDALTRILPLTLGPLPVVKTPGGGEHWYFKAPAEPIGNNAKAIPGCDFRGEGGYVVAPPSCGVNFEEYKWANGDISQFELVVLPSEYIAAVGAPPYIDHLAQGLKEKNNTLVLGGGVGEGSRDERAQSEGTVQSIAEPLLVEGCRDEKLFRLANSLMRSGMPTEQVEDYLMHFAMTANPPFPEKEALVKVRSAMKRDDKRVLSTYVAIKDYLENLVGTFTADQVARDLGLAPGVERTNLYKILSRLTAQGTIERTGKHGTYRMPDRDLHNLDILNAKVAVSPLVLPFGLEQWILVMPKNVIVIAGEPNAGKTAFMLNVADMNMDHMDVHYFSSEMGEMELRSRVEKFAALVPREGDLERWKQVKFSERGTDFDEVIAPDAVNIVDFLEVTDEFYKIGEWIRRIFSKLNTGVAIIAIQKNAKTDYGLGGMRGLEKARLYLAMEPGQLKVIKAKNWRTDVNPNGISCRFKLIGGAKFVTEEWKRER